MPLHVTSGYRSTQVNRAVGGARKSAHLDGRAADIVPIGMPLQRAFNILRRDLDLPYDQIITECNAWIHIAIAAEDEEPRRDMLAASGSPGHWSYAAVA